MTAKERAEVAAELAESGFCTHYPGYLCDRDWSKDPAVCPRCITSWIIRNGITQRDDSRIKPHTSGTSHGTLRHFTNEALKMDYPSGTSPEPEETEGKP